MTHLPIKVLLLLTFFCIHSFLWGQKTYPVDYFSNPLNNNLSLAGNFGEIRPNHFHAGFDLKTNNREGLPVFAIGDGYISRIKISPFGYGKAIYITHPNGYTSVYAHLQSFNNTIQHFTKSVHYSKQSFEIDTLLTPNTLPIKKGEQIALSGNTGGSQGPHLHFEIRDSKTEMPINPYLFGYKITDNVKPSILMVAIYPLSDEASINGQKSIKKIKAIYSNEKYSTPLNDTITANGMIGFGIETFDTEISGGNKNGVYSIELLNGGKRIYYHEMETFSFENARYVNAHIDYADKQKSNSKIEKCFLSKNNKIEIYKDVINKGIIHFNDNDIHWIKFIVKDYAGNTSELMLKVKGTTQTITTDKIKTKNIFDCTKENKFNQEEIEIIIPSNALYDDIDFSYSKTSAGKIAYAGIHKIHNTETALQKAYTLRIKTNNIPDSLTNKACIISINKNGKIIYEGGTFENNWVTTQTKSFGNFTIGIDSAPPKILHSYKFDSEQKINLSSNKTINITISDNLSGIKSYKATIDGNWILMEYEAKQNLLFYTFDESIKSGNHTFKLEVTDNRNNTSIMLFNFKK